MRLEPGKSWYGWLAGPVVTVHCHFVGQGCKSCRREMTSAQLECPYCADGAEPTRRCYVPLYSESGVQHVSIVGERYVEIAEDIPERSGVKVTKLLGRGCPIRAERWSKMPTSPPPEVNGAPADITPWLLRVWGDEQLTAWVMSRADPAVPDVPAAPPPRPARPAPEESGPIDLGEVIGGRLGALVAGKLARAEGHGSLSERFARAAAGPPTPNGKHGKKPKPK